MKTESNYGIARKSNNIKRITIMRNNVLTMIALLAINVVAMAQGVKCPNNKHPHMIDLGMPSGTKWACCNVGAATPYDLGNTYQWGETSVSEEVAGNDNYAYYDSKTKTYKDIGENISGTKNDVARAKWGGNWRMPTKAEMEELLSKCTHEMKEIKGKPVYVFYGKNKVSIAIPVDFFVEDGIGEIPVLTHYWTATHFKKGTSESLWIGPSESDGNDFEEVLGKDQCSACYIRPVCK